MHINALETLVETVRKRISEGDRPTAPPQSTETLEEMVDDLARLWRSSGNYTADDSTFPKALTFANGRVVEVRTRPDGDPYLVIGWTVPTGDPEPSRG